MVTSVLISSSRKRICDVVVGNTILFKFDLTFVQLF